MSAEAILDAIAVKAETVDGIKKAYGSGAGDAAVAKMPSQIADGPVALVTYEGTEPVILSQFEELRHRYSVDIYVQAPDEGFAYKTLIPFVSRFIAAFRLDRDLGGTCTEALFDGADGIEGVDINGRPYSRLSVRIVVREITYTTTSV